MTHYDIYKYRKLFIQLGYALPPESVKNHWLFLMNKMSLTKKLHIYITVIIIVFIAYGCKNERSEDTKNSVKEFTHTPTDSAILKYNNINIEEIDKISDFDILFVESTFRAEKIVYEKGSHTLKKYFLLTNMEVGNETYPYIGIFVYEMSLKDKGKKHPDLSEKILPNGYIKIFPETKAPHTCYLFYYNNKLFIIGYYGIYPPYESFDINFFISYVKNKNNRL